MFLEPRFLSQGDNRYPDRRAKPGAPPGVDAAPQDVFAAVWQRRWVVAWVLVACVGSAVAYLRFATPVYTATSRLYVTAEFADLAQRPVSERSKNYLSTQGELLKSTPILRPVAQIPDLATMKGFNGASDVELLLKEKLVVELGNNDDLIALSFDSTDRHEAAHVVNAVLDSYVAYQSDQKRTSAREMLKILRKEKESRQQELTARRLAVLKFKDENAVLSSRDDRAGIILARLAQLSQAKTAAQLEVIGSAAAYDTLRAALADPRRRDGAIAALVNDAAAAADRARAAMQGELHQAELKLAVMSRQLAREHPAVAALSEGAAQARRRLADLDAELAAARLTALEQTRLAAEQRLEVIDKAFQEQQQEALNLNATVTKLTALESGVQQSQELVEGIEARIQELGVTGETGALDVTVLERAVPPAEPSKPRKPLVLVAATLLGLVLGSSLAFIRASTDWRLRSSADAEDVLGIPVLSAVPRIGRRLSFARRLSPAVATGSAAADAFATIRTAICFGGGGRTGRTLLVTSASKGEGKSTLARNIAAAMARGGERTLLVDADLRRPSLHKTFNVDNRTGLSTVLDGDSPQRAIVHPTNIDRLYLLPSGPRPANPSELLSGPRLQRLLASQSKYYDRIVVDAPPVLGMPDALILGLLCDATVLVVRAGVSDRRATEAAAAALLNIGVRSIATVVNAVRGRNGYARYSRRYHGAEQQPSSFPCTSSKELAAVTSVRAPAPA
jgi:polysaccharide biosynthesis transport protein